MLNLPNYELLAQYIEEDLRVCEVFWESLIHHYIRNKGTTSLPYWAEKFSSARNFNIFLLIQKDYISTSVIPERNWAEAKLNERKLLELFTAPQLEEYRKEQKMEKYMPSAYPSTTKDLVKLGKKTAVTGIVREGFQRTSNTQFAYDTSTLVRYKEVVTKECTKGVDKLREVMDLPTDAAFYDKIIASVVDRISQQPEAIYTTGNNTSDSRGRAIKDCLKTVANPVGYKTFRALLVIPKD